MSITKKTFYIFITIFIIAMLIIGVFREKAISNMKGIMFGNISLNQAKNIASLLEENQKKLFNNAKDWGYWGSNYSFLNGKINHFIKNTFEGNNALTNLDIDYMFFFDKNKKLFYARSREGLVDKEITYLPKFFENLKDVLDFKSPSSMLYLSKDGKVFNVAFSPISKSDMKSVKPNGIFVVAKLVDKNFFENKKIKNIEISIANKETSSFTLLDGFSGYYFNFSNQKEILNTQVIYNQSNNNIIFTLATNQSKIISSMANTSYKIFATMSIVILFFMLFLYYFIVRKRVQKLDVLSNNIVSLSNSKDGLERFPTFEDSELQRLVNSIKSMAAEVIDQKELFENLFENIPTGVIIYRPNIVYANKYVLKILKTDIKTLETLSSADDLLSRSVLSEEKINELKTLTDERIKGKGKGEISTYETVLKLGEHELDVYVVSDTIKYKGEMAGIVAFVDISELKKVGKELDLLLQYSPLAIYHTMTKNEVSQIYFTSQSLYKHTGYKQNEVGVNWWFDHIHPSYVDGMVEKRKILESTRELNHIYKFRRKNGSYLYIKDQAYQINKKDEPREIIGFWDDATKDESLKRVSIALANINQMLLHVKSENEIFEKICRILVKDGPFFVACLNEYNFEENVLEAITQYGDDRGYLKELILHLNEYSKEGTSYKCIQNGKTISCNQNTITNEAMIPWKEDMLKANFFSSSSLLIKDKKNSKKYILNLYSDTTDMYFSELEKTLETLSYNVEFALKNMRNIQKLKFLSYHDSLCGLPNINAMQKELNKIKDPISICVLNIRDFSLINLNYGYEFGDKALCAIAKNIQNSISKSDKLFRLGGDKFAILLHNVHKNLAIDIITRIKKKLSSGINIEEHFVPVYLRMSLVSSPEDTLEVKTLHELGMSALGYGRESKRVILFEPWMLDLSKSRLSIERNIIDAIQDESFMVYYQPIVDAKNGTVCHLEALMRLNDKDGHPISPELLAKTAEEFGTINDITRIIVQKVAKQQKLWRQNGLNFRVAINISAADIADKNFFSMLEETLIKNGIGSDAISLEVTERAAIENLEVARGFISHARELGIKIEIDDFGVAHSSLNEISSIDFDYLKIDKSFVDKIGISIKSEKVIEFIIFLAKEFNAKTIAEGVETKEQSKWLKKAGCDFIQGYLYYRPMPAIEIEKKL